jgi:aminomethyltransferase
MNRTPLYDRHVAAGARMTEFAGWEMPIQYPDGILAEHLATRRAGGLFDVSHMGRFRIDGDGALPFLQHVLSNDAGALAPGAAQYTLIPDATGGLLDDAYLYRLPTGSYLLVVNASNRARDWDHLEHERRAFSDVVMRDVTADLAMIAFQGPATERILIALLGDAVAHTHRNRVVEGRLRGERVWVARTGYTGEPIGFELFMAGDAAAALWTALLDAGRPLGVGPVGLGARDTLRLEAGMPLFGHELGPGPDGSPLPAFALPLTRVAVSFAPSKGDFFGRAALRRQSETLAALREGNDTDTTALPQCIRPLALIDPGVARQGYPVFAHDRQIGVVTSGTTIPYWVFDEDDGSPTGQSARRSIALALLDIRYRAGDDVTVAMRDRQLAARIVRSHGQSSRPPYFRSLPPAP